MKPVKSISKEKLYLCFSINADTVEFFKASTIYIYIIKNIYNLSLLSLLRSFEILFVC